LGVARIGRSLVAATVLGAAGLLAAPLTAVAGERAVSRPGPVTASGHVHDTVVGAPLLRAAGQRSRAHTYRTADGHGVEVEVSRSYPADREADQAFVDFLATRLHGAELGALSVYVGTHREIARLCGGARVVACYSIAEARMYVPGEAVNGVSVEYALTHEYGHHLASWRSNNPWEALDWGAKHWASAARICTHVQRGLLFPGAQGRHYFDDPGEGFADGYAHLHYPSAPWGYNRLMRPGRAEFEAIRRDVLRPWAGPRTRTFRGRLGPGRPAGSFHIPVRLDGDVAVRLHPPLGADYTVQLDTPGFAAAAQADGFGVEWCRRRPVEQVRLTLRRREGAGAFALHVRWPG
jgi:hypothetical protein